ncbi:MAG: hypothetical protein ACXVP5_12995 [Tumebacillaceae bacterium]
MANKKDEGEPHMESIVRPCTPAESLDQSLKEMTEMLKGTLKKRSWKEFRDELKKTDQ